MAPWSPALCREVEAIKLGPALVGEFFELLAPVQVRTNEGTSSQLLAELPRGTHVRLLALGGGGRAGRPRRAKVVASGMRAGRGEAEGSACGWITVCTASGRSLISRASYGFVPLSRVDRTATTRASQSRALRRATAADAEDREHRSRHPRRTVFQSNEDVEHAAARAQLGAAVESNALEELRAAVARADAAGLSKPEVEHARVALRKEERKQAIMDRLALIGSVDMGNARVVRELLDEAADAGISESAAYIRVCNDLRTAEVRERVASRLKVVMDSTEHLDPSSSLGDLQDAKQELSVTIREAIEAGLTEWDLKEVERRRKQIHNAVEDAKGSVRVFCRVRPMNAKEEAEEEGTVVAKLDDMHLELTIQGYTYTAGAKEKEVFSFDSVLFPGTQEEVFEDCRDLIRSVLDGYNITVFSYGQTGAGKTHTMYGTETSPGLAPRTITELFQIVEEESSRWETSIAASMFEVYRNELIELLPDPATGSDAASIPPNSARSLVSSTPPRSGAIVRRPSATAPSCGRRASSDVARAVEAFNQHECQDAEEMKSLLDEGTKRRHVNATAMNSNSSRSHLILSISVTRTNKETRGKVTGKIMLCDLAGSERIKKSQATGEVAKEAIEINKSLTALSEVLNALTTGSKHVPYHNSKLTQILRDALGGSSKTLMFVNCSPAGSSCEETRNTLQYAKRAKKVVNHHPSHRATA